MFKLFCYQDKTSILQNLIYDQFRFGSFGFGSVNPTEISVSVVSVFTRFGRTLHDPALRCPLD